MAFSKFNRFKKKASSLSESETNQLKKDIASLKRYIEAETLAGRPCNQMMYDTLAAKENKLNPNLKMGAKKAYADGLAFESNIERNTYNELVKAGFTLGVNLEMQVHFPLQPAFKLDGVAVRAIDIFVDFLVDDKFVVESKGLDTPDWKLKWKMLKYSQRENYRYFVVHNKKEIEECIKQIKALNL